MNYTKLTEQIDALLSLDSSNALVPHGIGGHARSLLIQASCALKGLHKIAADIPADLFKLIQDEADNRGCTTLKACAELYCEGQLTYQRKFEHYDMAETMDRWTARYAQYTGPVSTLYVEVNAKRAQAVLDIANHHNVVFPNMNPLMMAVGLWATEGHQL
uniref:Uncharacterized protein n=1 Tax=Pseudomonas phage Cygsa01 TaxID=3138529 RepID=A0AAU6W3E7_9VIRU